MPKAIRSMLAVGIVLAVGVTASLAGNPASEAQAPAPEKPNVVLVVTDDMREADLEYMPQTKALLADQGMTFENAFNTYSLCCPGRASLLTGRYPHNHGVIDNKSPEYGFVGFRANGSEASTLATWLDDAGYRTGYVGKYLNGYAPDGEKTYVPPGWDEWYAPTSSDGSYYNYTLNENGYLVDYGSAEKDYMTDVLSRKSSAFVNRFAPSEEPFFLHLAPTAPHANLTPAARHATAYPDERIPRNGGQFNEQDVSDKPAWVQALPPMSQATRQEADEKYRQRLRMLLAVDEMVAKLVANLADLGELENTYIAFTSDNGYQLGEHRIDRAKRTPYEESIRMPLVMRGPGIPPGRTTGAQVLNTDLAPTFAALAGVTPASSVDGRSLEPLFAADPAAWRDASLVEHRATINYRYEIPGYYAVRTPTHKYVEYATGEKELYDLTSDPYEMNNAYDATADPTLIANLKARLEALKACAGDTCRTAEGES